MKVIIQKRMVKPQYYPEFLFNLIGAGREQTRCVEILHDFTRGVSEFLPHRLRFLLLLFPILFK